MTRRETILKLIATGGDCCQVRCQNCPLWRPGSNHAEWFCDNMDDEDVVAFMHRCLFDDDVEEVLSNTKE